MTHLRGFTDKSKAGQLYMVRGKDETGSPVNDLEDFFICIARGMSGTEDAVRSRICSTWITDIYGTRAALPNCLSLLVQGVASHLAIIPSRLFSPWTSSAAAWMQKLLLLIEQQSMSWDHHKWLWTQNSHRIHGGWCQGTLLPQHRTSGPTPIHHNLILFPATNSAFY